ncbi:MAG: ATP-binding protein [Thermodesulfobacteriota bacterium]
MKACDNHNKQKNEKSVKPWFIASVAVTLFLIALLGWNLFFSFTSLNSFKNRELAVERSSWELLLHAEAMKSAVRVSTYSGDLGLRQNYEATKSRLQQVLRGIPLLMDSEEIRAKTAKIETYLSDISIIEARVYDLVASGKKDEAERLLAGWDYQKNQRDFEKETKELGSLIRGRMESKASFYRMNALITIAVVLACLAGLIILWSITIRFWKIQTESKKKAENERARLKEQFHQSQRIESIGRLAGGVAHDLNNLLSPVLGYSEMLLEKNGLASEDRKSVEEVENAAKRARSLVHQLLAFGRKQTLEFRAVDVNELLKGFEKLLRRTIRENITMHMNLAPRLPCVRAEAGQLEQVVMNLAVNAQDAMPHGGELTIETSSAELDEYYAARHQSVVPGSYVLLTVADTGSGMDEYTRQNLFEPFFTTKELGKGTGLGLSTVYGIVKQHGGNIWAYGEPGMGSVFKVYLPAAEDSVHQQAETRQEQSCSPGSETLLLVEDNEQVRDLAFAVLKQQGYKVLTAEKGMEAVSLVKTLEEPVNLLVTDVVMPGIDGINLYNRISLICPEVKVLYMSGYPRDVISRHGGVDRGANFLSKPFSIRDLSSKVREVLDN